MPNSLDEIRKPTIPSTENPDSDPDTESLMLDDRNQIIESSKKAKLSSLEEELEEKRKRRDFSEEGWFYWVRIIAVGVVAFLSLSIIIIYWWHLIGHESCKWLNKDEVIHIERTAVAIIVGIVGTLATTYFLKKH